MLVLLTGALMLVAGLAPAPAAASEFAGRGALLVARDTGEGGSDLYLRDVATNQSRLLTSQEGGPYRHRAAVWSPDGSKIAYVRQEQVNGSWVGDVYVMDADGSNPVNVSNHLSDDAAPDWSPDGARLVYASNRTGTYQLHITAVSSLTTTRITPELVVATNTESFSPAWSPDGNFIAFSHRLVGSPDAQIHQLDLTTGMVAALTQSAGINGDAAYSPDGGFIAYSSNRLNSGDFDVYVRPASPGEPADDRRISDGATNEDSPQWVPKVNANAPTFLVYNRAVSGTENQLRIAGIDTDTLDVAGDTALQNYDDRDFEGVFRPLPGCTKVWTGGGGNANYTNSGNWEPSGSPTTSDAVCIPDMIAAVTVSISTNAAAGSLRSEEALVMSGGSLNAGDITAPQFSINGGQLNGSGTLDGQFTVAGAATWGGGPRTVAPDSTLSLTSTGAYQLPVAIDNEGVIDLGSVTTLSGSGALTIEEGATLRKQGAGTTTISKQLDNAGSVRVEAGTLAIPSQLTVAGQPAYDAETGSFTGGPYTVLPGAKLRFDGTMPVRENAATFDVAGSDSVTDSHGTLFRNLAANTGELTFRDGSRIATNQPLTNDGTVRLAGDSRLQAAGYVQTAGLTDLRSDQSELQADAAFSGGELTGSGTIVGVVSNAGATVAPGSPTGTLHVDGAFTQDALGVLEIAIDATDDHDTLAVSGPVTLDGVVAFTMDDGVSLGFTEVLTVVDTTQVATADPLAVTGLPQTAPGSEYRLAVDRSTGRLVLDLHDTVNPFAPAAGDLVSTTHTSGMWSRTRTVSLSVVNPGQDNAGGSGFADYDTTWSNRAGTTVATGLAAPDLPTGRYRATVRTRDNKGNLSDEALVLGPFLIDASAPTRVKVSSPGAKKVSLLTRGGTKPRVRATWKAAADTHSGIAGYRIRYRSVAAGGSRWSRWTSKNRDAGTRSLVLDAKPGTTYCFVLEARDRVGNVTRTVGQRCVATPLDDTALRKAGRWRTVQAAGHYRGSAETTATAGATLARRGVRAKRVWLVASTCPTCGKVEVYLGSTKLATRSLQGKAARKVVIPVKVLARPRSGTVSVRVTSTGKPVTIDGVAVSVR